MVGFIGVRTTDAIAAGVNCGVGIVGNGASGERTDGGDGGRVALVSGEISGGRCGDVGIVGGGAGDGDCGAWHVGADGAELWIGSGNNNKSGGVESGGGGGRIVGLDDGLALSGTVVVVVGSGNGQYVGVNRGVGFVKR